MPLSGLNPPRARRAVPPGRLTWVYIHDQIAHGKEHSRRKRFSEEIRQIIGGAHEWHSQQMSLDAFANVKVSALDVLSTAVVLVVVRRLIPGLPGLGFSYRRVPTPGRFGGM